MCVHVHTCVWEGVEVNGDLLQGSSTPGPWPAAGLQNLKGQATILEHCCV